MEPTVNGKLFEGEIKGGTPQLFPSAPYLTGRAKYPRGFTPERLREVEATTRLRPQHDHPTRSAATAKTRDVLARSTVPVDDLKGVSWYQTTVERQGFEGGTYHGIDRSSFPGSRAITLTPGSAGGDVVLHELGHHVSEMKGTPHSAYDGTVVMGQEEAYADNYAETHFRDRRGRALTQNRSNPEFWTREGQRGGLHGGFHEGYRQMRDEGSPVVQNERAARIAHTERLLNGHPLHPAGHVQGQIPLIGGNMTGSADSGDQRVKWDYTDEQQAAGLKRDAPEEAHLTPASVKVRAARLPKGTKVRTKVEWSSGTVR